MGHGVYFTSNPFKAMEYGHSTVTGDYYLILTKVLVGDYCAYLPHCKRAPLKFFACLKVLNGTRRHQSPQFACVKATNDVQCSKYVKDSNYDRYDCVVDNMEHPHVFVAFHDDQMLPQYIVRFRRCKTHMQEELNQSA